MHRCTAPWYEMNIANTTNVVSACCYYEGRKDVWRNEPAPIEEYWNGAGLRALRRIHGANGSDNAGGCSDCFFYKNRGDSEVYFDFAGVDNSELTSEQTDNLRQARRDFEDDREESGSTPLRLYINFGDTCNLNCTMCSLVPRRRTNPPFVSAASVLAWPEALRRALDVSVIGGEPFALPEAVKFIKAFIDNPLHDGVRLSLFTNGTVIHKHMNLLRRKRKLSIAISLDSIEEGFESIRVNGKWDVVERNIRSVLELQRSTHPEWRLFTNAVLQKRAIPLLPRFAEFHSSLGLETFFSDFHNSDGNEDTFYDQNALQNPGLLDDLPDWETYFEQAIQTFAGGNLPGAAASLDRYRKRLRGAVAAHCARAKSPPVVAARRLRPLPKAEDANHLATTNFTFFPADAAAAPSAELDGRLAFKMWRRGDFAVTGPFLAESFGSGILQARMRWRDPARLRRAHVAIRSQAHPAIENEDLGAMSNEDLGAMNIDRSFSKLRDGSWELTLRRQLPRGRHLVQLLATPTGEDESVLPDFVELTVGDIGVLDRFLGRIPLSSIKGLCGCTPFAMERAVLIGTPTEQWAYAAKAILELGAIDRAHMVAVELEVQTGTVGIGWFSEGCWVARVFADEATTRAELILPPGMIAGELVFENADPGGRASVAVVKTVELIRLIPTSAEEDAGPPPDPLKAEGGTTGNIDHVLGQMPLGWITGLNGCTPVAIDLDIVIATPPDQWAFAASAAFELKDTGRAHVVAVELEVKSGLIGIGWTFEDRWVNRVFADETTARAELILPPGTAAGELVFENANTGGLASIAVIKTIELRESEPTPHR
jgi:Radical SAM superfamily